MQDVVWSPTAAYVDRANVTRFMRAHGIGTYDELVRRSIEDIAWFWDAVVRDLGIEFYEPYRQVLDTSAGIPWSTSDSTTFTCPATMPGWSGMRTGRITSSTPAGTRRPS